MSKRYSVLTLFTSTFVLGLAVADRPNIVVILVDDMGFSDIGCYGSEIPTPNLSKRGDAQTKEDCVPVPCYLRATTPSTVLVPRRDVRRPLVPHGNSCDPPWRQSTLQRLRTVAQIHLGRDFFCRDRRHSAN